MNLSPKHTIGCHENKNQTANPYQLSNFEPIKFEPINYKKLYPLDKYLK